MHVVIEQSIVLHTLDTVSISQDNIELGRLTIVIVHLFSFGIHTSGYIGSEKAIVLTWGCSCSSNMPDLSVRIRYLLEQESDS